MTRFHKLSLHVFVRLVTLTGRTVTQMPGDGSQVLHWHALEFIEFCCHTFLKLIMYSMHAQCKALYLSELQCDIRIPIAIESCTLKHPVQTSVAVT